MQTYTLFYPFKYRNQFFIEIQKLQTSIQSNFSLDSILLDDSLNFGVELTSIDGGISADLEVLLDGNPLTVAITDSFGNSAINLVPTWRWDICIQHESSTFPTPYNRAASRYYYSYVFVLRSF